MSLEHLPVSASVFVIAVVALGCAVLIIQGPRQITHPTQFVALLAASVLASSLRLRLPLGTSASNLSISYSVDFAALLLIGREMTMLVAGASACAQSIFGTNRRNPAFRILFNASALVLTVQAVRHDVHAISADSPASSISSRSPSRSSRAPWPTTWSTRSSSPPLSGSRPGSRCGQSGRRTSCGPRPATSSAPAPRLLAPSCGRRASGGCCRWRPRRSI